MRVKRGRTNGGHPNCPQIINAVYLCLDKARQLFGFHAVPAHLPVYFFPKGNTLGRGGWCRITGRGFVEFSLEAVDRHFHDTLTDTVPHEVAHVICHYNNWGRGHGYNWKRVCAALGGKPIRCHSLDVTAARKHIKYECVLPSGRVEYVGSAVRKRMLRGTIYTFRDTKEKLTADCLTGRIKA